MFLKSMILIPKHSRQRKFTYEIYQKEQKIIINKRALMPTYNELRKKPKFKKYKANSCFPYLYRADCNKTRQSEHFIV